MWLLTTFIAALGASLFWIIFKKKYKLDLLSLMLWGATIMILVDHILGYDGGSFISTETEGIIQNSTLLGALMLVPIVFIWIGALLKKKTRSE